MPLECNICFRITSSLYSLCMCNNCAICLTCIRELQNHQITTCPFCRATLDFNVEIDRRGQIKYIGMMSLFIILVLVFEIILPSILICNESKKSDRDLNIFNNNALIVTLILISVVLLQPITYSIDKLTQYNERSHNNLYINFVKFSLGYNIIIDILLLTLIKHDMHFYYFLLVIFPVFFIPFLIKFIHMLFLFLFSQMSCYSGNYRLNRIVPIERI